MIAKNAGKFILRRQQRRTDMDYMELVNRLKSPTWQDLEDPDSSLLPEAVTAITDLLARAEAAEERAEKAENIASDLCDDFTDFVTGGVPNAAPYCANFRPECVNQRGWCNGDNKVCKGFLPKAAVVKEE